MTQTAVSKLEQRADLYVSSLRSHVKAAGGRASRREVATTNFSQLGEAEDTPLLKELNHRLA